jgi:hypothetical protein
MAHFSDKDFPPDKSSLGSEELTKNLDWKRPKEFAEFVILPSTILIQFNDTYSPFQVFSMFRNALSLQGYDRKKVTHFP